MAILEKFKLNTTETIANQAVSGLLDNILTTTGQVISVNIPQTTAGVSLTLGLPHTPQGRAVSLIINNTGTVGLTVEGFNIAAGKSGSFQFTGTAWHSPTTSSSIPNATLLEMQARTIETSYASPFDVGQQRGKYKEFTSITLPEFPILIYPDGSSIENGDRVILTDKNRGVREYNLTSNTWFDPEPVYDPANFGAKPDRRDGTATISAGSTAVTVTGLNLTATDVGKSLIVQGASNTYSSGVLLATVVSVGSVTSAVLSAPATVGVTNSPAWVGTNHKPIFDLVFAELISAGGGGIRLTNGKYLWVDTSNSFTTYDTFTSKASNFVFEGYGGKADIIFGSLRGISTGHATLDVARNCTNTANVPATCTLPGYGLAVTERFTSALVGAMSITLNTPAEAASFAAGDRVFIQSGSQGVTFGHPPVNYEWATVLNSNPGTGVITFTKGLTRSYDSLNATYPANIGNAGIVPSNILFRNLILKSATNLGMPVVDVCQSQHVRFTECEIHGLMWAGFSQDVTFDHNLITSGYGTATSDFGDAVINLTFEFNTFEKIGGFALSCAKTGRSYRLINNTVNEYGGTQNISKGFDCRGDDSIVANNHIVMHPSNASAIHISGTNVSVTGNNITGSCDLPASRGITLEEFSVKVAVTGNSIKIRGRASGIGLIQSTPDVLQGITITGNTVEVSDYGIISTALPGAFIEAIVSANSFTGADNFSNYYSTGDTRYSFGTEVTVSTVAPSAAPPRANLFYFDSTAKKLYFSESIYSVAHWIILN